MDELKNLLAKAAPWLAAAAAGPAGLAAQAIKTAAEALGASSTSVSAVTAALAGATAEQLGDLKAAEQGFQERMEALGFQNLQAMEALAAADRDSARRMQIAAPSRVPAALTVCIVFVFMLTLGLLLRYEMPPANKDTLVYMIGALSAAFAASIGYWFGTTRGSGEKTKLLAQADALK